MTDEEGLTNFAKNKIHVKNSMPLVQQILHQEQGLGLYLMETENNVEGFLFR